jgi:hypothetical protein
MLIIAHRGNVSGPNEAIADGKRVKIFPINKMWGLGTPEDLNFFLANHK